MSEVLTAGAAVASALGLLVGALLGHWFAIGRDRRKEINEAAEAIHSRLMRSGHLDSVDAAIYTQRLRLFARWRFRRAIERYDKARKNHDQDPTYGTDTYTPDAHAELRASIDALLRLTRQRLG